MGIWEELRSVAAKLINRKSSDNHYAVTKPVDSVKLNGAQRFDEQQLTEASHRENISRILINIGKFAVDETIKGVAGGIHVNKTAKDHSTLHDCDENKKKSVFLLMEEMPAKIEKMQDNIISVKQQHEISKQCDNKGLEPLNELSDEPCEVPAPLEDGKKRVFIRSRL